MMRCFGILTLFIQVACLELSDKSSSSDDDGERREGGKQGDCFDGEDNDDDGDIDCDDEGCADKPACTDPEDDTGISVETDDDTNNNQGSVQYAGGYSTSPCSPNSTGYGVGDTSHDWSLIDQHGEMVTLSDFCGQTIIIETSAFW